MPLPSVRLLITLIVVVPIAAVSVALIWIAGVTSRSVAEQLAHEIVVGATRQVSKHIESYLGSAMRISDTYVRRIHDGYLQPNDLHAWERVMFQDLATNPDVASICFATPQGVCTWLLRSPRVGGAELELGYAASAQPDSAQEFPARLDGTVDREHPIRTYTYEATKRDWYTDAMRTPDPVWTKIYHWFPNRDREQTAAVTGTGYTRQVFDHDGKLLGVLIIDVTVAALSKHLRELDLTQNGYAFIVDDGDQLVAASDSSVSEGGKRFTLANSPSPAARACAELIVPSTQAATDDVQTSAGVSKRVFIGAAAEPARAQASHIQHTILLPGINWRIITVLPEKSFLGQTDALRRRAILLAVGAIVGGTALGLLLSRNLSRPLLRLTEHVGRVGAGDFDRRLDLRNASELRRLSDEVNRMAGGLKERMVMEQSLSVATQVQQGLLPASIPMPNGVQIAACSKYCDSTGGDYYDFLEIADLAGKSTLIAVGDVTGHGIGAALLMATARGAVRASTPGAPSLGHILTRTNRVLSAQGNHGMFMTLSLVSVDPASRTIRWSSAGHDPSIVYHPDADAFEELTGGDIPLGIECDVTYRESSRLCATPGSIIVIGTDGIWEARNPQGEMFGKHRLRELMRNHHGSADELSAAIKGAMYGWVGDHPLQDDVTFVILKIAKC